MTVDAHDNENSLAVDYAENPIIRAMVRLIPFSVGSAVDVLILHQAGKIKESRTREFFDALGEGRITLSQELIENNDFIHCLDTTLRAALRSRRNEKIRLFARLLQNGMMDAQADSVDDYEELVGLIDDLSFREWEALLIFERHLSAVEPDPNPLARVNQIWDEFVDDLNRILGVHKEEASSFMNRIARTGLYNEITGAYWDYAGGLGIVTAKFARLRKIVDERF